MTSTSKWLSDSSDRKLTPTPSHPKVGSYERAIIDALSAHIAILDNKGVICCTNQAWQQFGLENGFKAPAEMIGLNYLEICEASTGEDVEISQKVAKGIRLVMQGRAKVFNLEYPCHSPKKQMWFYLRVTKVSSADPFCVVVSHEDITPLKLAQEKIRKREEELKVKTHGLVETNAALRVLLKQREEDKHEMESKVVGNVKQLVMRYVDKIKETRLDEAQQQYVELIESNLNDIISPFLQRVVNMPLHLTPQEIQVASLIKMDKSTKEIADYLNITVNAVDFHRKNIRKKFGLTHRKTNLRSFLLSLK